MAAESSVGGGADVNSSTGNRFLISLGLMVLAEACLFAGRSVFHSRGQAAPALDTLVWVWPMCWLIIIALCMFLASWGRLVSHPAKGVTGNRQVAAVMLLRLCISAGLLMVPMVAVLYALVMLALALVSANSVVPG